MTFCSFNLGRRMCLGENLAKIELFLFTSHLLHRYTFSKPEEDPPLSFQGRMHATNCPLPFRIVVTERDWLLTAYKHNRVLIAQYS